jgi:hypothetical protein
MSTVRDLAQASLEEIGVYAPGESVLDADAQRVLDQLQKMLDSWSGENLMAFAILEQSVALTVNKSAYTIGTSGSPDINATRPLKIMQGPGRAYIKDGSSVKYYLDVVERDLWNQQTGQANQTSQIARILFYDPTYPNGTINIFPQPNTAGYTLFFDSHQQLQAGAIVTLDSTISFPPGYEAGIQHNLAVWSGPFFKNALVSQDVKDLADRTKRIIKRVNKRTIVAEFDREIISRGAPTYNIFRDGYGGR